MSPLEHSTALERKSETKADDEAPQPPPTAALEPEPPSHGPLMTAHPAPDQADGAAGHHPNDDIPESLSAPVLEAKAPAALPSLTIATTTASLSEGPPADVTMQHLAAPAPAGYVDPTPATPVTSQPPSRSPSHARSHRSDEDEDDAKSHVSEDDPDGGSRSEIQSIMEQFSEVGGGPGEDEVMSPRLEMASPRMAGPIQLPTRNSSLEPLTSSISAQLHDFSAMRISTSSPSPSSSRFKDRRVDDQGPPVPPKDGAFTGARHKLERIPTAHASPTSPALPVHRPPPPEPEPEPALPFDFHRFLEQLRNKKADPVARYLKSFLSEFGKRQWMVHEQVKIIGDFLVFIGNKMALCDVWRDVSDAEFDNAREGMEKLVMNRLYSQTFSPAIPSPKPVPGAKPKRKGADVPMGPGRRGQHQEDMERDDVLTQKINIYGWVKEEHLDIPAIGESGRRFLKLAQQELLKIKAYRAPRDKIICVLNCSKVIFGLLKHNKSDSSADSFMPLLIYVVLQSNPEHLVSNVQYILRFRNQEKLGGEAGYYLSSLMGAVQFIENMDRSSLTISDDEFEKNVEAAVSAIAERHYLTSPVITQQATFGERGHAARHVSEARPSTDLGAVSTPPRSPISPEDESREDGPAITGLLRSIQRPLSTIGRIFSDEPGPSSSPMSSSMSPSAPKAEHAASDGHPPSSFPRPPPAKHHGLSAEEAAARQASAEAAEAQRLQRAEHANVVETLAGMFPDLDKEIISDVVYQKEGRVGLAVDACLALST
ncbi:hypothetical protein CP533_5781 [Ophiocordyceps camponoti-saundersi (nom. inval.)]|nr:hypothetical protein CP533_5781 [Ophiocordyceps camponoti-saundersi (nom. inval.)]